MSTKFAAIDRKIALLTNHGFHVGERDPNRNSQHSGCLMVADEHYCIVGNNLSELADEAIRHFELENYLTPNPLVQALEFCELRVRLNMDVEFYRRLAGSLRKAHQIEIDNGRD